MTTHQDYLPVESSSIRNLGVQGCGLSYSVSCPTAYSRGTTNMPPSLFADNRATKLWLAAVDRPDPTSTKTSTEEATRSR